MTEWIPPIAVMTEERDAILRLVRLCKRYQAQAMAANTALSLSLATPETRVLADEILQLKQELLASTEREVEIEFRAIEHALCSGTEFLTTLQEVLDRHRP